MARFHHTLLWAQDESGLGELGGLFSTTKMLLEAHTELLLPLLTLLQPLAPTGLSSCECTIGKHSKPIGKAGQSAFHPQLKTPLVITFVLEALYRRLSHHYLWLLFVLYHVNVLLQERGLAPFCIAPPTSSWLRMIILLIFSFHVSQPSLARFHLSSGNNDGTEMCRSLLKQAICWQEKMWLKNSSKSFNNPFF